jgi:DNA-binding response OmpR family regulator
MTRLLVIEDDPAVARGMVRGLERAGYAVELARDGETGLERACDPSFDLVVLDLMLPELAGVQVLQRLRARVQTPVIVVSAKSGLESRLEAFELGAVDFVAKPFWMEELVARTRSRLEARRPREVLRWDDVEVDLEARAVRVGGVDAELTPIELAVLTYLVRRAGRAVSRDELVEGALDKSDATERTVDSHVARIRRKLGRGAVALQTVRGFGYRLAVAPDGAR